MMANGTDAVVSEAGRGFLRLQMTEDVGPVRVRQLIKHFGSLDRVRSASMAELQRVDGIGPQAARSIFRGRHNEAVGLEISRAAELGLRIVCPEDQDYPRTLLHIHDPPICLYVRGHLEPTDGVAISIVGTRRCSHYGREQARRFAQLLGQAGFTIVSGLARGIDSHAHRAAIECGARTIAVLGNGLDQIYPPEHESLGAEIANSGAVVSEMALDSPPDAKNFPRRNRIIAGLSLGVLVVEAGQRSGALITARLATDYNREVFALPGRVDQPAMTAGVHSLIRDGCAKLVTCLEDVLDELKEVGSIMQPETPSSPNASDGEALDQKPSATGLGSLERAILDALTEGEEEVDRICAATRISIDKVNSTLTALQLKGLVTRLPGNQFALRRSRRD